MLDTASHLRAVYRCHLSVISVMYDCRHGNDAYVCVTSLLCRRMAPDESMLGNATLLAGVLPSVDAIIQTLQYNATDEIITFSASMDPGALLSVDVESVTAFATKQTDLETHAGLKIHALEHHEPPDMRANGATSTDLKAIVHLGCLCSSNHTVAPVEPDVCPACSGALNRAEWIKFLGTFFNLDAAATAYFNGVVEAYNATKVQCPRQCA